MIDYSIKLIAFYLPQYHPVPENDMWWGKGFTEWTNVVKASPLFNGHYQPHIPADLGFYDLRLEEVRKSQADLAKEYGVYGFCYYHYWFNGNQLLERPFNGVLNSGKPDFPFCLCWANENWTRRWDGCDEEILQKQIYSPEDDVAHIEFLIPAFKDPRYIKVDNKPLFLIYRMGHLPDPQATIARWKEKVISEGLPGLFLCNVESFTTEHGLAEKIGIDGSVEFAPDWTKLGPAKAKSFRSKILHRLKNWGRIEKGYARHSISDYETLAKNMSAKPQPKYLRFPCVTPMWDNSPRRYSGGVILDGSTPEKYAIWLRNAVERARNMPAGRQIVFINAWNEWAEGNHLEPCQRWGKAYLEATRNALQ